MPTGHSGLGTLLKIKYAEMLELETVANITNVDAPEFSRDLIDVSSGDSTLFRSFVGGLIDPGDMSFSGNTTTALAANLILDAMAEETIEVEVHFVNANLKATFSGVLTSFRPASAPYDDKITFTGSIKAAGAVVLEAITV